MIERLPDNLLFEAIQLRVDAGQSNIFHIQAMDLAVNHGLVNAAAITGPVHAQLWPDIQTFWDETLVSIVTGARPITAFDDFVRFFYANNGQAIINEITALNSR